MNLLDLIFPKRCVSCGRFGSYICRDCFSKIEEIDKPVCSVCQRQAVEGKTHPGCINRYRLDGLVVAVKYQGAVKKAIQKVKYKWVYDIEKVLVKLLVSALWKYDLPKNVVLVPVPLHVRRKRWRGFNQSEILAKSLAQAFEVRFSDLLIRERETKTQVGLKKEERKKNVEGAFVIKPAVDVRDKNIVLVDDVFTTGATMSECCRVLKKGGAKSVWAMSVALG